MSRFRTKPLTANLECIGLGFFGAVEGETSDIEAEECFCTFSEVETQTTRLNWSLRSTSTLSCSSQGDHKVWVKYLDAEWWGQRARLQN